MVNKKSNEGTFNEPITGRRIFSHESELVMALTENCVQYKWRVPSYFPCCPEDIGGDPPQEYFNKLKVGAVFTYNDAYPQSTILEFVKARNNSSILVMCEKKALNHGQLRKLHLRMVCLFTPT
ncbi:hypothetical protein [Legionella sainthelensi]|uniref:hypothetical protein n=1 Tax=Legionella sainthelensi TaxID=28087 RepID=UPI001FCF9A95|nr:hypothetical protein [Legionella sainthelensi]